MLKTSGKHGVLNEVLTLWSKNKPAKPLALLIEASRASVQDMQARVAGDGGLSGISLNRAKLVLPYPEILIPDS